MEACSAVRRGVSERLPVRAASFSSGEATLGQIPDLKGVRPERASPHRPSRSLHLSKPARYPVPEVNDVRPAHFHSNPSVGHGPDAARRLGRARRLCGNWPRRRTCVASGRNRRILRRRSRPRQYGACRLQRERRRGELAVAGDRNGRDARLCVEFDRSSDLRRCRVGFEFARGLCNAPAGLSSDPRSGLRPATETFVRPLTPPADQSITACAAASRDGTGAALGERISASSGNALRPWCGGVCDGASGLCAGRSFEALTAPLNLSYYLRR